MGKKCIPGVICIENMTLFILFVLVIILTYMYYTNIVKIQQQQKPITTTEKIIIVSQPPSLAGISTRNDILNDPYAPPLKNDGYYFSSNSGDIRAVPQVPINIETRGLNTQYSQIGILTKSSHDDLILPLMGRRHMSGRDKWQYYTISNTGNLNTKLPISVNGKSCTSEYGCDQIMNGDSVYVEGYKNTFKATVYENNMFSYIPVL
jgi:hypothetical protein